MHSREHLPNLPRYFAFHLLDYRRNVRRMPQWTILAQIEVDSNNLPIYEKLAVRDTKIGILAHNYHYSRYLRLRLRVLLAEVRRRWSLSPKEVNGSLV